MMRLGMWELLTILGIVLIFFGPAKLPALAKSMGQAMSEFKKGSNEVKKNIETLANEPVVVDEPAATTTTTTATTENNTTA